MTLAINPDAATTPRGWVNEKAALEGFTMACQDHGLDLSDRTWLNWVGSGHFMAWTGPVDGSRWFNPLNIGDVVRRYAESGRRAISIFKLEFRDGGWVEEVNTWQCAQMWGVGQRQAENIIGSGLAGARMVGNEHFVRRDAAEELAQSRRARLPSPPSGVPSRPGIERSSLSTHGPITSEHFGYSPLAP